ncbi:hypothetical protein CHUAL_008290 [Chamberlinius hualienensis]
MASQRKVTALLVVAITGFLMAMAINDIHIASTKTIRRRSIMGPRSTWRNHHQLPIPQLNAYPNYLYNDLCASKESLTNLCQNIQNCSFVIETMARIQITVCAKSGYVPVICCPLRSPEEAISLINSLFAQQQQLQPPMTNGHGWSLYHRPPLPLTSSQYQNHQTSSLISAISNPNRYSTEQLGEMSMTGIVSQVKNKLNLNYKTPSNMSATHHKTPKPDISINTENGSLVYSVKNQAGDNTSTITTEKPKQQNCGLPSYNVVESRSIRSPVLTRPNSKYPTNIFQGTSMIVGGNVAAVGSFPWMAAIYKSIRLAGHYRSNFICAGSLVDRWHIVTAAHCIDKRDDLSVFIVRVGDQNLPPSPHVDIGSQIGDIGIDKIIFHPDYTPPQVYNDLAIIRLSKPVPLDTGRYLPICLPPDNSDNTTFFNLTGMDATVTGWGATGTGRPASSVLQQVTLPILPNVRCDQAYGNVLGMSVYFPKGISEDMLCAGYETGGKDACQGDSGGPLMVLDNKDQWTLIGIVSVGRGCAEPGFPGLYTRITQYIPWIINATGAT